MASKKIYILLNDDEIVPASSDEQSIYRYVHNRILENSNITIQSIIKEFDENGKYRIPHISYRITETTYYENNIL